jgi:hypothetical protein
MWCGTYGDQAHEGCCEGCIGHTTDGQCVTEQLLDEWQGDGQQMAEVVSS